jgi:hypothetical protein
MHKFDWDVVVDNIPYQVVKIDNYIHSIGSYHGENDLWMYPRHEEPTYENLIEFHCHGNGVQWGINFEPHNYIRSKWGETECFTSNRVIITRNGRKFCSCCSIDEAKVKIEELKEHPLDLDFFNYSEKMMGRKVWWRSDPAIITHYINGQACIILKPDGIDKFTVPAEFTNESDIYYEEGDVKVSIFSEHIWWFRD